MDDKKKYRIKYITVAQAKQNKDIRDFKKPFLKTTTVRAETPRSAAYLVWTGKNGSAIDHIVSITEVAEGSEPSPALKYKVGWYDKNEKRRYTELDSKEEVLDLIADLMDYPGQISVKRVTSFEL